MNYKKLSAIDRLILIIDEEAELVAEGGIVRLKIDERLDEINKENIEKILERLVMQEEYIDWDDSNNWPTNTFLLRVINSRAIKMWANEIRQIFGDELTQKSMKINYGDLLIDCDRALVQLSSGSIASNINFDHQSMLLLKDVVMAKGEVVEYEKFYKALGIVDYTGADGLKQIKNGVKTYLVDQGMNENDAVRIREGIKSIRGRGYRFQI